MWNIQQRLIGFSDSIKALILLSCFFLVIMIEKWVFSHRVDYEAILFWAFFTMLALLKIFKATLKPLPYNRQTEEAYLQNLENKYINLIKSKLETKNLKITLDNATLLQAIEEFLSQKRQVIYKGFKNKLKLYFLTALKWSLFLIIPTLYLYYSFLLKGINTIDAIFLVDATKSFLYSFSMGYAVRHLIKTEFSISLETQDFPRLKEFIKNKFV